ncbi:MAG: CvpA family protein [Rhodobacterales bacterium]|nr:CvpA family protein [Rhodobacterales bacterium]
MDKLPLNGVDIVIIAVLLLSALLAYARGFVHEVLSAGSWVGAILIAYFGYPYVTPYAERYIPADFAAASAFIALLLVSKVVLSVLIRAVSSTVQASSLNALDRSLGFLFGLVRGAFIVCLAYLVISWMLPPSKQPDWLRNARAMPLVEAGTSLMWDLLPDEARQAGADAAGRARQGAEATVQDRMEQEKDRILRDVLSPKPKGQDKGDAEGYGDTVRRGLDRLIENNQQ